MNARGLALLLALWLAPAALAQGFAGMGTEAEGFSTPEPGTSFEFPRDHGPHPDYRIEWWYLTANLTGDDGRNYGLQWTLFRTALAPRTEPGWSDPQVWMGHAAITTPERHFVSERLARGGIGQAGVVTAPFRAWIDDWQMAGAEDLSNLRLTASAPDFAYDMRLLARGPLVPQGDGGYSVKSAQGQASYYYSQPFFEITGTLDLPDGPVEVRGDAWLDREWSSQPLSDNQSGWDWFSLVFEDDTRLMGFRLRQTDGSAYTSATWIAQDGTPTPYPDGAFRATPLNAVEVAGRQVPTHWRVELADKGVSVNVRALNDQAWMDTSVPYWEGPVHIEGSHAGRGYLEMTGYE